ncbi:uncharacterized protein [Argopecten irradians]
MDYMKLTLTTLWIACVIALTQIQGSQSQTCPDGHFRAEGTFNGIRVTCCIPNTLRGTARCTRKGGYTKIQTTHPPLTTPKLDTVNTLRPNTRPIITRPTVTLRTTTTTPTTTTCETPSTAAATTDPPNPTTDEDEGSGDETNTGNVEEGKDEENRTAAGLSIGIPLVVLVAVVVAVLLLRVRYKRKKMSPNGDLTNLTENGRVFVKPTMGNAISQNDEYQDFEKNVPTSPPLDTYESLHLYGNAVEPQHSYEQVPDKRDPAMYEALHVYGNAQMGQADYDVPTSRVLYANLKGHSQSKR